MARLITHVRDEVSLGDATLEVFGAKAIATALLYRPDRYLFARWSTGTGFCVAGALPVASETVFEAQMFTREVTLHWRRRNGVSGQASVFSAQLALDENWRPSIFDDAYAIENRHMLWGKFDRDLGEGWTRLSAARIGGLDVPLDVASGQKVVLAGSSWFRADPGACGNPEYLGDSLHELLVEAVPDTAGASVQGSGR